MWQQLVRGRGKGRGYFSLPLFPSFAIYFCLVEMPLSLLQFFKVQVHDMSLLLLLLVLFRYNAAAATFGNSRTTTPTKKSYYHN